VNILEILQEFVAEKKLDQATLISIASEGIVEAYKRKYPDLPLRVVLTPEHEFVVEIEKEIVSRVADQDREISLLKARNIKSKAKAGETLWVPFEGKIGRVEILKARQIISSHIRNIETKQLYDLFKPKEGEIIVGIVQKYERSGVVVSIGEAFAFLPKSNMIPEEHLVVGYSIRALLKEVLTEPVEDHQLILDRISPLFVQRLFELEIPEVFDRIVEIKEVVRAPGYRTKVVVTSKDRNIDPVGTCVGVAGSRIKPILKEISGEKVDVIGWNESLEIRVKNALKPAVIDRIELSNDEKTASVWLPEDQRAIAIGKGGKNVALVTKLTGVNVQFMTNEKPQGDENQEYQEEETREQESSFDEQE
jgi:transcription termination/antitermination protein NusA